MISVKMTEATSISVQFLQNKTLFGETCNAPHASFAPFFTALHFYLNIIHSLWQTASLRNLKQKHCGAYEKQSDDDKSYRNIKGASRHLQFVRCHLTSNKSGDNPVLICSVEIWLTVHWRPLGTFVLVCKRHTTTTSVTATLKKKRILPILIKS